MSHSDRHNLHNRRKSRPRSFWNLIRLPVYLAAGFTGAWLIYRSLGLYQTTFLKWGLPLTGQVCQTFDPIPFMGWLVNQACTGLAGFIIGLIAFVALLAVTALQLVPTLLYFHPKSISDMIAQLRHNRKNSIDHESPTAIDGDSEETLQLVDRYYRLNDETLRTLIVFSVGAFAMEAFIIWVARGGRADIVSVLVDSLAFDALVASTLVFNNLFNIKTKPEIRTLPLQPKLVNHPKQDEQPQTKSVKLTKRGNRSQRKLINLPGQGKTPTNP